jgi:Putative bacterial sensory transduction regulator
LTEDVAAVVERALVEREAEFSRDADGAFTVTLPGEHKLKTLCRLEVGDHALRIIAFVVRKPDENQEEVYAWLLRQNARLYGVAWTLDKTGDVYLTGRLALHAVTEEEIDRLLGSVLVASDGAFDRLLEMGFATSIRREWDWRVSRGESLRNLQAFAHLATERPATDEPAAE